MPLLHDPFDLLDTDIKVAPILPAGKVDEMVAHATAQPQMAALPAAKPAISYRLYGGIAIAACLLLTFGFLSTTTPDSEKGSGDMAASYSIQPKQKTMFAENNSDDLHEGDIGDYLILATFEDQ